MDYGKEQKFDLDQYNLDTNEWDYSPGRDNRALGNKIISSPDTQTNPDASHSLDAPNAETEKSLNPELIAPLMPPNSSPEPTSPQPHPQSPPVTPSGSPIAPLIQKAQSSEKFTYHDAKTAEDSVNSELAQTGDIASVYEEIRAGSTPTGEAI